MWPINIIRQYRNMIPAPIGAKKLSDFCKESVNSIGRSGVSRESLVNHKKKKSQPISTPSITSDIFVVVIVYGSAPNNQPHHNRR
jgi:hypothetical protein